MTADPSSSSAGAGGQSGSPSRAARPAKPSRRHAPRFHPPPRPPARGVHVHAPPRPRPARPGCRPPPPPRPAPGPGRTRPRTSGSSTGSSSGWSPRPLAAPDVVDAEQGSSGRGSSYPRTRRSSPATTRRRSTSVSALQPLRRGRAWRSSDVREVVRDEDRSRSIRYGRRREMNETGGEMSFLEDLGSGSCLSDIFRRQ